MDIQAIIVSAIVGVITSAITAYITARFKIRQEQDKWQREFALKYAELQSTDPARARSVAKQFGLGVLIIEWCDSSERERVFVPPNCRLVAGRGKENDIDTRDNFTSRQHTAILADESDVYAQDLGSTNATFVNDLRISGKRKLRTGDVVRLGNTRLTFHEV